MDRGAEEIEWITKFISPRRSPIPWNSCPPEQQTEVAHTIDRLVANPLQNSYAVPFADAAEMRLARAGDWRLIFRYVPAENTVLIMDLRNKEELSV